MPGSREPAGLTDLASTRLPATIVVTSVTASVAPVPFPVTRTVPVSTVPRDTPPGIEICTTTSRDAPGLSVTAAIGLLARSKNAYDQPFGLAAVRRNVSPTLPVFVTVCW